MHQLGAALAALLAGMVRTSMGDYRPAFWVAGVLCFLTGFVFLGCRRWLERRATPVMA